jgi:hypothetical protein
MFGLFGGISYLPPGNPQVQASPRTKITATGVSAAQHGPVGLNSLFFSLPFPFLPHLLHAAAKELLDVGASEGRAGHSDDAHRGACSAPAAVLVQMMISMT